MIEVIEGGVTSLLITHHGGSAFKDFEKQRSISSTAFEGHIFLLLNNLLTYPLSSIVCLQSIDSCDEIAYIDRCSCAHNNDLCLAAV